MTTKNMKKVAFYFDKHTQAIVEAIPPFYRSFVIREMIKKAASEGRLDVMVRDAIGIEANTSVPEMDEESIEAAPSMDKSDCQSFKRLKRIQPMPTARRYPQPRTPRSFQTRRHLRHTEHDECMERAIDQEMDQMLDEVIQNVLEQRQEEPKSLNELPMCEVLGERPRADRQTCASCIHIVRPCPY